MMTMKEPISRRSLKTTLRKLAQFQLRTLLLVLAALATWFSYSTAQSLIRRESAAIDVLHQLAPELVVRSENEYACLSMDRLDDLMEYQCYLPKNGSYRLGLIHSQDIPANDRLIPELSCQLEPGRHQILIDLRETRLIIRVDGKDVMDVPVENLPTTYSTSSLAGTHDRQWYPLNSQLRLWIRNAVETRTNANLSSQVPTAAKKGIALWIECLN